MNAEYDKGYQNGYDAGYKRAMLDYGLEDDKPCEDTISRKHLLSEIDDLMKSPWFNNGKDDDMFTHYGYVERKEAVELVRDLCVKEEPPVTPKQKTGKWIVEKSELNITVKCSCCNYIVNYFWSDWNKANYCPNCGAEMEGESE